MKKIIYILSFFLSVFLGCEQWDYDRIDFVQVSTGDLQEIDFLSAKVEGNLAGLKNGAVSQYGHVWTATDDTPGISNPDHPKTEFGDRSTNGSFSSDLNNLEMNTTYKVRAYAQFEENIIYGEEQNFTTLDLIISIETQEDQNPTSQPLRGSIFGPSIPITDNLELRLPIIQHGFVWSSENEVPNLENDNRLNKGILNEYGEFEAELTGLAEETNYYVRSFAVILGRDTLYSDEVIRFHSFPVGVGWERMADFPGEPREAAFFFAIESKAYVGGGRIGIDPNSYANFHDYWEFDLLSNSWRSLGILPGVNPASNEASFSPFSLGFLIGDTAYLSIQGKIRQFTSADLWEDLIDIDTLSAGGNLVGFSLGGNGFIIDASNGVSGDGNTYAFLPSVNKKELRLISQVPVDKILFKLITIEAVGKAYLIFTDNSIWSFTPSLLPMDPWKAVGNYSGPPIDYGFSIDGKYYFTEEDLSPRFPFMKVWQFDPSSITGERFKRMPDLPTYIGESNHFIIDGKVYIGLHRGIDGIVDPSQDYTRELWQFTPPK